MSRLLMEVGDGRVGGERSLSLLIAHFPHPLFWDNEKKFQLASLRSAGSDANIRMHTNDTNTFSLLLV